MSRLYRSQKDAIEIHGDEFKERHPDGVWPICVPSYNRPKPKILTHIYEHLPLVFFVREEQLDDYRYLRDKYRVVPIKDVSNIGETRAKIIKWATVKGYDQIFMLDDDITLLDYMYPGRTKNGQLCMRTAYANEGGKIRISTDAFKIWMLWVDRLDKDLTLSSPAYRPNAWGPNYIDIPIKYNSEAVIQCMYVNVANLNKHGLTYRSSDIVGNEDYALQFDVMSSGLKTAIIHDIMYNCPKVNSHPGGCEGASGIQDPEERYQHYYNLFIRNVSGKNHPGVRVKIAQSGLKSIGLNWRYWRNLVDG